MEKCKKLGFTRHHKLMAASQREGQSTKLAGGGLVQKNQSFLWGFHDLQKAPAAFEKGPKFQPNEQKPWEKGQRSKHSNTSRKASEKHFNH